MPRLWTETIETHRREVHEAILETTWRLAAEHGLLAVTMSRVAEQTGIGRATLYKYFPDVRSILMAGHERHVAAHVAELQALRRRHSRPADRLRAVLLAYAFIARNRRKHGNDELDALVHTGPQVQRAQQQILDVLRDVLGEAAGAGALRTDVGVDELALFCLHALAAAGNLRSDRAVERLVSVTLAGLRPPTGGA